MRPVLRLDAVAISSSDFDRTTTFYRLLGFDFPPHTDSDQHIEAIRRDGEPRLMIDSHALMRELTGRDPTPPSHSAFALLCPAPAIVDQTAKAIETAGFSVETAPWDAFWGQRYATVVDPDGYRIDLFAPLPAD